jgi:hypothetical protein
MIIIYWGVTTHNPIDRYLYTKPHRILSQQTLNFKHHVSIQSMQKQGYWRYSKVHSSQWSKVELQLTYPCSTHWIGCWVGPILDMDILEKTRPPALTRNWNMVPWWLNLHPLCYPSSLIADRTLMEWNMYINITYTDSNKVWQSL